MIPRHLGYEVAIVAVICTVAIFAFPAASGPYSAVHGPVTALLSLRVKFKLWLAMALAAFQLAGLVMPRLAAQRAAESMIPLPQSVPPEQIAILRC
jgi:hypothetical protein